MCVCVNVQAGVEKLDNQEITPQDREAAARNKELVQYAQALASSR